MAHQHSGSCGCSIEAKEASVADSLLPWVDTVKVTGKNCKEPSAPFKGYYDRFEVKDCAYSPEDDAEMIVHVPFTAQVRMTSICVMQPDAKFAPNHVKIWKNRDDIDFLSVKDIKPNQEFDLPHDPKGEIDVPVKVFEFTNINSITLFFSGSFGGKQTKIQYIGLKGKGSRNKRGIVNVMYEARANPADHKTEEEKLNPFVI